MNPPSAVKDSLQAVIGLARDLEAAGQAAGFRAERFGEVAGCPLFALTRRTPGARPRIYVSAGIHGDEPAPVQALLRLIQAGSFDAHAVWFVCPLLNPAGLARGTRENADGVDLNRDYLGPRTAEIRAHVAWLRRQPPFDLTLCLHEDWESKGFYLYEQNPEQRPSLAGSILAAMAGICPIEPDGLVDGREARGGIIRPVGDPLERENWPEAIYLRAHHTSLAYTLEAPSALPMEQRVRAMAAAVGAAIRGTADAPRKSP